MESQRCGVAPLWLCVGEGLEKAQWHYLAFVQGGFVPQHLPYARHFSFFSLFASSGLQDAALVLEPRGCESV